jgi:methionyl aminopeptidase
MIHIKTPEEMDGMRAAGKVAATVKEMIIKEIKPGVTTRELDMYGKELIEKMGGVSAFYDYRIGKKTYPGYTCISVNEEVVHGIPGDRKIQLGDIVSLDVGVAFEGFIGDNASTVMIGVTDPEILRLVTVARKALDAGIAQAIEGNRVGDISHAVQEVAEEAGFYIVREFVGHGVGRNMHEDPQIPNYGPPGKGSKLREGMTLAIEPMLNIGTEKVDELSDGWTVVTRDRKPSAHVEHTVAVGKEKPEILTVAMEKLPA